MGDASGGTFETFVAEVEPPLRRALVATYGLERGREATAEALLWAWENWDRARHLEHKVAYLYRVGQSKSRRRKEPIIFDRQDELGSQHEPDLATALAALSERQRIPVVLIEGFGWTLRDVAELLSISVSSVQTHLERGLRHLRNALEVVEHE